MSLQCDMAGRCICKSGFMGRRCEISRQVPKLKENARRSQQIRVPPRRWGVSSASGCPRGAYRPATPVIGNCVHCMGWNLVFTWVWSSCRLFFFFKFVIRVLQSTKLSRNAQAQKTSSLLRCFPTSRASHSANDNAGQKGNSRISPEAATSTAICTKYMADVHTYTNGISGIFMAFSRVQLPLLTIQEPKV